MLKLKYIIAAVLIILCSYLLWTIVFKSDRKVIRSHIHLVSQLFSKQIEDSQLQVATKIKKLTGLAGEKCQLKLIPYAIEGIYPRKILAQNAMAYLSATKYFTAELSDISIDLQDKVSAKVLTTAVISGETIDGESLDNTHIIEYWLQKVEKKWVFVRIVLFE